MAIETSLKWQLSISRRDINCHWETLWAIQILFPFRITFIRPVCYDIFLWNSVRLLKVGSECALLPRSKGCQCLPPPPPKKKQQQKTTTTTNKKKNVSFFFFLFLGIITVVVVIDIHPFTAPACKISGLTEANSIFPGHITNLLSMLWVLRETIFHAGAKRKTEMLKGFEFGTFICHLQVTSWQ